MSLTLRHLQPCSRCVSHAACVTVLRELENTVERLAWYETAHAIVMPECEVVLDCKAFCPPSKLKESS